jgi:GNAT superfamily N-acetyltransferase
VKQTYTQLSTPDQLFHLREAELSDFDTVATLFEALHIYNASLDTCFGLSDDWHALLKDYFTRTCTDPHVLWVLAWQGHEPVGLLIVKSHLDSPLFQHRNWTELMAIYVVPSCRGTRLGKLLVECARDWTITRGCHRMQLYVTAKNEQARRFYQGCGLYPVQEIWRLDIAPEHCAALEDDEDDEPDTDFLEPGHHHYLGGKNVTE